MNKELKLILQDADPNTPGSSEVTITWTNKGIRIHPEDTSTHEGVAPIQIERYQGDVKITVWNDIDKAEPSHTISMFGARERNRGQPEGYKQDALKSLPAKYTSVFENGQEVTTNCLFNPETNECFDIEVSDIEVESSLVSEYVTLGDMRLTEEDGVTFNY